MTSKLEGQYRQFVFKPDDGGLSPDAITSDQMAFSTMPVPNNLDEICLLHTIKPGNLVPVEVVMHRMWLHEILDENKIKYLVETASVWINRRKHGQVQSIYVKNCDLQKAQKLKKAYKIAPLSDFVDENISPSTNGSSPQSSCKACDESSDFDYIKCPHCKSDKQCVK